MILRLPPLPVDPKLGDVVTLVIHSFGVVDMTFKGQFWAMTRIRKSFVADDEPRAGA